MENTGDYRWFDEKVQAGGLTYSDKRKLFEQVFSEAGINVSSRTMRRLEGILKNAIFNLKSNGSESAHAIAHNLLTCICPFIGLDKEQYEKLNQQYQQAMQKHKKRCAFKKNYSHQ